MSKNIFDLDAEETTVEQRRELIDEYRILRIKFADLDAKGQATKKKKSKPEPENADPLAIKVLG